MSSYRPQDRSAVRVVLGLEFLLGLLLVVVPVVAQESDGDPSSGTFIDSVDVQVVNVEAVVTLRGERVEGLDREDFRLEVEGREVPIDYFSAVRDGRVSGTGGAADPEIAPAIGEGGAVPNQYLVFVDESLTSPTGRRRTAKALRRQLDLLGPGEQVMIVAFDGDLVHVLTELTSDGQSIEAGVESVLDRWDQGVSKQLRLLGEQDCRTRELVLLELIGRSVDATGAALRRFGPQFPPGRRILVWISGGWPLQGPAGVGSTGHCVPQFDEPGVPRSVNTFYGSGAAGTSRRAETDRLVGLANQNSFSIYAVDAQGSESRLPLDETNNPFGYTDNTTLGGEAGGADRLLGGDESEKHAMFRRLASRTGGMALLNFQRNRVFEELRADTSSYYWLGFHLPPELRGLRENPELEIALSLRDPSLRKAEVRARENTVSLTPERERDLDAEALVLFDQEMPADVRDGLVVRLSDARKAGFGKRKVAAEVRIPVADFTWIPTGEGGLGELQMEVRFQTIDPRDSRSDVGRQEVRMPGPKPQAGNFAFVEMELVLKNQKQDLAVTVVDPLSDLTYFERLSWEP